MGGESSAEPTDLSLRDSPAASSTSPRWQFSIRALIMATLAMSLLAATLKAFGPGVAMLAVGCGVLVANSAGWLARWQSPTSRPRWLATGWLLFAVSLGCPAAQGCNNKPIYGLEAATGLAVSQGEFMLKVAVDHDQRVEALGQFMKQPWPAINGVILYSAINAANVTALLAPLLWLRWRQHRWSHFRWIVLAGLGVSLSLSLQEANGLRFGYYLWCGSFLVISCVWKITWRDQAKLWIGAACFAGLELLASWDR
jgi:hypothetical protein